MSDQKVEAPNESDIDGISRALIHAEQVISEALGSKLSGSRADDGHVKCLPGGNVCLAVDTLTPCSCEM